MTKLVTIEGNEPVTDTLVIAIGAGRQHKNTIHLVRKYISAFETLGRVTFQTRRSNRGQSSTVAVLNEAQVYFLFTLFSNKDQVVKFKLKLVTEFMRMKDALINLQIEQNNSEWIKTREQGKLVRKETTDVIQDFVRYATVQGSKHAVMYYANITKMENKSLLILEQKFPNVRKMLTNHQLSTMKSADRVVLEALVYGMDNKMDYKDIYKLAKERVETLATLIKPTMVINYNEVKVLES